MNEKRDLRSIRTQRHLREALCELMREKPINKITIRELTERAEISRCTFYLYHDSIYSMLKSMENDMLSDFREELRTIISQTTDSRQLIAKIIEFSFQHSEEHLHYCRLIYSGPGNPDFIRQYSQLIIEELDRAYPVKTNRELEMAMNFYITGVVSSIQTWVANEVRETPKEMSIRVIDIITNGGAYLDTFNARSKKQ